jgi:pimeloyl-ACP methyl ester carboxylesterase
LPTWPDQARLRALARGWKEGVVKSDGHLPTVTARGRPSRRFVRVLEGGRLVMSDHEVLETTISGDGTPIGYWRTGNGPPLVLVHGTTADHTRWRTVLPLLEPHATIYAIDRRGRGASGDADVYTIDREFADVAAVLDAVADATGGPVDLIGHSYGAICALETTALTTAVRRLVLYEPPVQAPPRSTATDRIAELLAAGRRAEVVETFIREVARVPESDIELLKSLPSWPARVAAAHTVVREERLGDHYRFEPERFATLTVPTLLLAGSESPPFLQISTDAVAAAVPGARVVVLTGQAHNAMETDPDRFIAEVLDFLRPDAS